MIRIISRRYGCREDVPTVTVTFGGGRPITPISGDVEINVPAGTAWADIGNYGTLPVFFDLDTGKESVAGLFTFTQDGTDFIEGGYEINEDILLWASYPITLTFGWSSVMMPDSTVVITGDTVVRVPKGSRVRDVDHLFPTATVDGFDAFDWWSNPDTDLSSGLLNNVRISDTAIGWDADFGNTDKLFLDPDMRLEEDMSLYVFPLFPLDMLPAGYERLMFLAGGYGYTNDYPDYGRPYIDTELTVEAGDTLDTCLWVKQNTGQVNQGAVTWGEYYNASLNLYGTANVPRVNNSSTYTGSSFTVSTYMHRIALDLGRMRGLFGGEGTIGTRSGYMKLFARDLDSTAFGEFLTGQESVTEKKNIYLFHPNGYDPGTMSSARMIFYYYHKRGGAYIAKMLPCRRTADGMLGMYDIVRDRFFTTPVGSFGSVVWSRFY